MSFDHLGRGWLRVKAFRWMLVGPLPHIAIVWDGREKISKGVKAD